MHVNQSELAFKTHVMWVYMPTLCAYYYYWNLDSKYNFSVTQWILITTQCRSRSSISYFVVQWCAFLLRSIIAHQHQFTTKVKKCPPLRVYSEKGHGRKGDRLSAWSVSSDFWGQSISWTTFCFPSQNYSNSRSTLGIEQKASIWPVQSNGIHSPADWLNQGFRQWSLREANAVSWPIH